MVIAALILILAGSFAGAAALWLQDASVWRIVLGYVAGGWAGLLAGLAGLLLHRAAGRLRRTGQNRAARPLALKQQRPPG